MLRKKLHSYVDEAAQLNQDGKTLEAMAVWNKGLQHYMDILLKFMTKMPTKDTTMLIMVFQAIFDKLAEDFPEQKKIADEMSKLCEIKVEQKPTKEK